MRECRQHDCRQPASHRLQRIQINILKQQSTLPEWAVSDNTLLDSSPKVYLALVNSVSGREMADECGLGVGVVAKGSTQG